MKTTIKIEGKKKGLKIDTSFHWLRIYRDTFGHDILSDILPMIDMVIGFMSALLRDEDIDIDEVESRLYEMESLTAVQIVWALAKNADDDLPDYEDWEKTIDKFPIENFIEVLEILSKTYMTTKKSQPLTAELKKRLFQSMNLSSQQPTEG